MYSSTPVHLYVRVHMRILYVELELNIPGLFSLIPPLGS